MENHFEIRKVNQNDIEELAALYEQVWPDVSFDKLEKASFVIGKSSGISYCAVKNGEIVGSRTSFFMPAYYGQRKLNCVQFADSCIREDCRRQGLFLKMNQAFLDGFFNQQPGELVYNISVDASRAAYEKLGWNYIKSLHGLRTYTNLLGLLFKIHFDPRKLRGAPVFDKTSDVASLPNELFEAREAFFLKKESIHIKYTEDTFNWRIQSGNGIKVRMFDNIGAIVYKYGEKQSGITYLLVGEVFLKEYTYSCFKKLMDKVVKELHSDILDVVLTLGHPLLPFYKRYGLKDRNFYYNQGIRVETDEMKKICYEPQNWAMSFMDIDTF